MPVIPLGFKSPCALLHSPLCPCTGGSQRLWQLPKPGGTQCISQGTPPTPARAGLLESSSRGCPQGWWHVPSTLFPPRPAGADEGEPGLPQGFSITGAAPGPSSLLLLSIRGETGRAERSLCLALLHGFLSCLSPTDLVPSVSPAARQPCRGRWVGAGLAQPGGIAGTRWWHPRCPGVPRGVVGTGPSPGLFPSKQAGAPGVPHPVAQGWCCGCTGGGVGRERRDVGGHCFPFLPSFLALPVLSVIPALGLLKPPNPPIFNSSK